MDGDWKIPDPEQRPSRSVSQQKPAQFGSSMKNSAVRPKRSFPIALTIFLIAVLLPILGMFAYMLLVPAMKNISISQPVTQKPKLVWLSGDAAHEAFGGKWVSARVIDPENLLKYGTNLWDMYEDAYTSNNPESINAFQGESKSLFSSVFGEQGLVGLEFPRSSFALEANPDDSSKFTFGVLIGKRPLPDGGERTFKINISTRFDRTSFEQALFGGNEASKNQTVKVLLIPYYSEMDEVRKNIRSLEFDKQSRLGHMNKWITSSTITIKINADFAGAQVAENNLPLRSFVKGERASDPTDDELR